MAVLVEHDKRKHEILEKALDLFMEEGYEDVTFQKIADRCGITRTTLYIYFKNKREIFLWSIKLVTNSLEQELVSIIKDETLTSPQCLKSILWKVLDVCQENQQLFKVLLTYLIQLQKSGADPQERVNRRVIRMQHLLSTVVIRGQKKGEIKKLGIKEINELLYSLMESAIFQLAVLNQKNLDSIRSLVGFAVDEISL